MTHPPIPPKCKFFHNANSYWVPIIAAVAEVEWRKRAARWEELIDALYNDQGNLVERHRQPGTNGRFSLFRTAANICYDHAELWRKWGEENKQ